jgi:heme/copper-type cytochrome/quinol oxidase subunit 2
MMRTARLARGAIAASVVLIASACAPDAGDVAEAPDAEPTDQAVESQRAEETDDGPSEPTPETEQPAEPVAAGSVTAYVVGYHWGWALFDEEGTALDVLEVPTGTEVELVAVNDHASHAIGQLPDAVA